MKVNIGDNLDIIVIDTHNLQQSYLQLTVQPAFDLSNIFEAQDKNEQLFVAYTGSSIKLTTQELNELNVIQSSPNIIKAVNQRYTCFIAKSGTGTIPLLQGDLKGMFSFKCNSQQMKLQSQNISNVWTAQGSIDQLGVIQTLIGQVIGNTFSAQMIISGQQYKLIGVISDDQQIKGQWMNEYNQQGTFALQRDQSYNKLDIKIQSSDCPVYLKWKGSYTESGSDIPFTFTDFKISGNFIQASGKEYTRTFKLIGTIMNNKVRLVKTYTDNPQKYIVMRLNVYNNTMQGIWISGASNGSVTMQTI